MLLSKKVAIITGGSRGIGRGIAMRFAEEGCCISIADVLEVEAKDTLQEITQKGREGISIKCDVTDSGDVQAMVDQTISKFGKVDILVNNAGIGAEPVSISDVSEEEWDRILEINLKSVFLCCKAVVPHMKEKRYGKIINISSMGAIYPRMGIHPYSAAKAGILGLARSLALELAPFNICVNSILPGAIRTPILDSAIPPGTNQEKFYAELASKNLMQKFGTPEDVAGPALFYATDLSGYITGDQAMVGGGFPLKKMDALNNNVTANNEH